jgi:hypothetical protein
MLNFSDFLEILFLVLSKPKYIGKFWYRLFSEQNESRDIPMKYSWKLPKT